jgi:hypothetical protein
MTHAHNGHPNKMDLIQKNVVKNEMWIRARDTRQPMRAIFDEVRDL